MRSKISLQGVSKIFETRQDVVHALQDFNLEIGDEEFLCIVGPSGSGKSTVLNIVAGFLEVSSGRALLDDRDIRRPGADRAVVSQADAVFPWMTVAQNVEYGPKVRGVPRKERQEIVRRFLKLVDLEGCEQLYPKELSGGMKKRVDLARAYANDPEVLLMDEPFGALDAFTKEKMQLELLRIFDQERKTVVFITHDIEEAIFLGDRVVVMTAKPAKVGAVIEIPFAKPRTPELKTRPEFQEIRKKAHDLLTRAESGALSTRG